MYICVYTLMHAYMRLRVQPRSDENVGYTTLSLSALSPQDRVSQGNLELGIFQWAG